MISAYKVNQTKSISLVNVPEPEPNANEIRISVECVGVCGSDCEIFEGFRTPKIVNGIPTLGHEVVGKVDAVGHNIRGPKIGDRVVSVDTWGAFAEKVISVPENTMIVDDKIDVLDACLLEVLPGVMMTALSSGITGKSRVLIIGQGVSGLLLTRLIYLAGCESITVVDPNHHKLKISKDFGASHLINSSFADYTKQFKEDNLELFDVAIVATRGSELLTSLPNLLREKSSIIFYGGLDINTNIDLYALHKKSISLIKESSSVRGIIEARRLWREGQQLVIDGLIPLHRLRTHVFAFSDAEEALKLRCKQESEAIHVVLECASESVSNEITDKVD